MERWQCEFGGIADPGDMGTTGLVAWVLASGGLRGGYNRLQRAAAVIRRRGLSVERFCDALMAEAGGNRWLRERLSRQARSLPEFRRVAETNPN